MSSLYHTVAICYSRVRSEVEQSILTQKQKTIFFEMLVTTTSLRKKSYTLANTLKSLFSECYIFFYDGRFIFFGPKMVTFHDFPRNPPKSMKNKGKLSETNVFPLCFIDFDQKSWNATIFGSKNINHPSSKKHFFY